MIDWLALWGVTQAAGFVFKPILEDLAKDAAKNYVKDFFKSCLSKVSQLPEKEAQQIQIATGKALTEFLKLIQQELILAKLDKTAVLQYKPYLEEFIKNKEVAEILGSAFKNQSINTKTLKSTWQKLQLKTLPDQFNWEKVSTLYSYKVKEIIQETPELREILNSQNLKRLADAVPVQPEFDLIKYRESLRERYGNLNLENLDTTGYAYNALKLWRIFIPQNVRECQEYLPQIYELPKEYLKQLKERGELDENISSENLKELDRRRSLYSQQQIQSVLEVVNNPDYQYLVILGDPGSGKSTLLQYLALNWAELPPKELPDRPIPLLIELRTYNREKQSKKCKDFLEFFHEGNVTCRLPQQEVHTRLQRGEVLVMFDGLDEVFDPAQRKEIITDIHRFTNDYPKIRAIATSRVIGYKAQPLRDAQFRHFMLQDLEDEQIEEFIQNWHELTFTDEADKIRKRDRLKQGISTSSAIRELAGNPLLLTMMAILNRNQELPRDRPELYNQASRVLLHQWDIERTLRDEKIDPIAIDYKDKQEILRRVAFFMQKNEQGLAGNLINRENLELILTEYLRDIVSDARTIARALIEQLRTRNFILCYVGSDFYAFVHRTFLEYFCAWEFVWEFEKERSLTEDQLVQVYADHWREETWHEVLRLMAGMLDAKFIGKVLEYLIAQDGEADKFMNLFLAAECLAEVRTRHSVRTVADELFEKIKDLTHYYLHYDYEAYISGEAELVLEIRIQAVQTVANTWKERPDTLNILKTLAENDEDWDVRRAAVQELAKCYKDDPDTLNILKTRAKNDEDWAVRRAAVQELAKGYKDDPDTLNILKTRAKNDKDWDVRRAAVQELAKGYKDHSYTVVTFLKTQAENDQDWRVRRAAVQELAKGYKDHSYTLKILKSWAENDQDSFVRSDVRFVAVWELAKGYRDHPDTLNILKTLAENHQDWAVRCGAVEELAQGYKDDPDTVNILKSCAENDQDSFVRQTAVRELARGYKNDPDTLTWLKTLAKNHQDWAVRCGAVEELARGYEDHPDTFSILKSRAENDQDSFVRQTAVEELARGYKDHPETVNILQSRAENDQDSDVQCAAVEELARGYKDHPDTLTWLKTLAENHQDWDVRQTAVEELARGYEDHPETVNILQSRAENDEDSDVRYVAVQELAQGWKDEPWMFEFLQNRILNDPFEREEKWQDNPREIALKAIIKNYPNHPQTLPLLQDRAENDSDERLSEWAKEQLEKLENRSV
ncbi:MAG: HEAT repeat domain-containing protein [Lyngbya sp.]|nr:HEAT repeat domain-containing protein [Lyngbya sp.]